MAENKISDLKDESSNLDAELGVSMPTTPSKPQEVSLGAPEALTPKDLEEVLDVYQNQIYLVNNSTVPAMLKSAKLIFIPKDNIPTGLLLNFLPLDHCDRKDENELPEKVSMHEEYRACLHWFMCHQPPATQDQCFTSLRQFPDYKDVWPDLKNLLRQKWEKKQIEKARRVLTAMGEFMPPTNEEKTADQKMTD